MTIADLTRVPANRPRSIASRIRAFTPRPVRAAAMAAAIRLCNPATANRTALFLLIGYAVLWALASTIGKTGETLHGDMAEAFALSRALSIGYAKHPPLIDWVVAGWFSVMPVARWSFYLLSYLNAALALGAVWLTAGYVVDAKRRVLAVALLALVPIFNFHSGTFNHNTFQTSLWALATLAFFASIERRELLYSVLFGIAAAFALLGKYYAIWIDFALFGASLLHPNRALYWRSWRPYVAGATALIVLAPHLAWQIPFRVVDSEMVVHVNQAGEKRGVPQVEPALAGMLRQVPGVTNPVDPVPADYDGGIRDHRRGRPIEESSGSDDHGVSPQP